MWLGANSTAAADSSTDRLMIPLNKNSTDGMIDSASARNTLLLRKQAAQMPQ